MEGSFGSITAVIRAYENANRTDFVKYLEKSKEKKKRTGAPRDSGLPGPRGPIQEELR